LIDTATCILTSTIKFSILNIITVVYMFPFGWIDLAEDRDRWQALVNAIINLQVP
jgi:hypothetical protein